MFLFFVIILLWLAFIMMMTTYLAVEGDLVPQIRESRSLGFFEWTMRGLLPRSDNPSMLEAWAIHLNERRR